MRRATARGLPADAGHGRRTCAGPRAPGLRTDAAIEPGSVVSSSYDSLVAKVMAHAGSRPAAIARLARALRAHRARRSGDQP